MLEYLPWKKKAKEPTTVSAVLTHNEAVEGPTTISTATTATTATPESPKPVLSHNDEEFLKKTLEDTDDQPVVILQGSESTTPSISPSVALLATPPSGTPAAANKSDGAEVKGKSKKKKEKEEKAAEWKEEIRNRWEGLRRSASSAVDKRKGKGKVEEGDVKRSRKGKEREKERLEVEEGLLLFLNGGGGRAGADLWITEEKSEEDELRGALDRLNLAARGV